MKIITGLSHLDHGLSEQHINYIRSKYKERNSFFIETSELPQQLGALQSGIYGPIVGDLPVSESEVFYETRGERKGESRLIDKPTRETRLLTVIAGPTKNHKCVLYTSYGGPCAPKEPFDSEEGKELDESKAFWTEHALAKGS